MLEKIKAALEEAFDIPVFYGTSMQAEGKNIFDYIVFWRARTTLKPNSKGDLTDYYDVALVRRDCIPEGEESKVRDVLRDLPGLKETGDIEYDYMTKPGTKLAMEVAVYHFLAARKRLPVSVTEPEVSE